MVRKRWWVTAFVALLARLTVACGIGSQAAPECSVSTDSCSCTSVAQDSGNGVACPAAGTTGMLCCADVDYPKYEAQSCTCVALRIGCEAGGTYCDCHATTDPNAVLAATCTKPTGWSMCCKGFANDCHCLANPATTCILTT